VRGLRGRPAVILLSILLIVLLPAGAFTDDARALMRALAREQGCRTPSLAAQTKDGGVLEVTVTCLKPGEDGP
jgi:hypothetical protein